mgnify:FL=1
MLTKQQQFEFIHNYASEFSISLLLKLTTVSRAGYYKWKNSQPGQHQDRDLALYQLILDVFNESKKTYGVRRIKTALLNKHGLIINHKCIRRLMNKYGLVCVLPIPKFKRRPQPFGTIGNILNREFSAEKPLQKLCLDITYIIVNHPYPKWIYLCAVKDLYNHEIVAYDVSPTQNMMQVFRVLNQVSKLPLADQAILHTDQGFQFTNKYYMKRVADMGLIQSMSRRGNCWDNACIENFFRHLKAEMPHFGTSETLEDVSMTINEYINYYNHKRIQTKYGMSPIEFRLHAA